MRPIWKITLSVCLFATGCISTVCALAAGGTQVCLSTASLACYRAFQAPADGGTLHYYASLQPPIAEAGTGPTAALIALHGHPRDADKTFSAALKAVHGADALERTLVVAPVFQVDADRAQKCRTPDVPAAVSGDALWTCASWLEGGRADTGLTSFAALDALVAELVRQWPTLRTVTIAGFSAGAQMVQHYIGFANASQAAPQGVALRYVVSDPGTWLYFDAVRPEPPVAGSCPEIDRWKYGIEALPSWLGRDAATARQRYAEADVHYLEVALDTGNLPGTYYRILDKSCAAMAQGADRLQRGLAFGAYDRAVLAPQKQRQVTVVPGYAHDVACVFPSPAARSALIGPYALPQR